MLTRRKQLAIKVEVTEGSAETLTATEVIDAMNVQFTPGIEAAERDPVRSSLSPQASVMGKRMATVSFEMEIKGAAGGAGVAAPFSVPLQACGVEETLVVSTSATYLPASASIPSVTLGVFMDGKRYLVWGARGTATLILEAGQPGRIRFEFTGADFSETDTALLSGVTYNATLPPVFQGVTLTIDSYPATLTRLEIAFNNTLALRPDATAASGHKSTVISGRRPTLSFDPENVLITSEDYLGNWRSGAEMALSVSGFGSASGNTIGLTAPKVQYQGINETERDGVAALDINALLVANSGDDELQLQIT